MRHLMPCTSCQRHLRADAEECPFCGAEVVPVAVPGRPLERLGRAAMFAFGATVLASGCGESITRDGGPDGTDAGRRDGGPENPFDAGPGGFDAGFDAGAVAPPYGIPPDDAGPDEDGGPPDAGNDIALYGGAPGEP